MGIIWSNNSPLPNQAQNFRKCLVSLVHQCSSFLWLMFSFPHVSSAEASSGSGSSVSHAHAPTCTASHAPGPCCSTGPHGGPHGGPHRGPNGAAHDPPIPCHATIWTTHADPHTASCHAQEVRVLMRFDAFFIGFLGRREGGNRFWSENQGRNGKPGNWETGSWNCCMLPSWWLPPYCESTPSHNIQMKRCQAPKKWWVGPGQDLGHCFGFWWIVRGSRPNRWFEIGNAYEMRRDIPLLVVTSVPISYHLRPVFVGNSWICNTPSTCHYLDLT